MQFKKCLDEPSQPHKPEIVDYNEQGVELEWKAPDNDGGAPIEKYIIEKKDATKPEWEVATEVPGNQLKGKVNNLKERSEFQFRIIAVNKAGPSKPSDASILQIIKHKCCKLIIRILTFFKFGN